MGKLQSTKTGNFNMIYSTYLLVAPNNVAPTAQI